MAIKIGTADEGTVTIDINKLVDSRMLIQANSGGGKSYLLRLLCERAVEQVPIIILDPEGEFASLREKVDAVLVGSQGDIPTDLRSAALLARKLIELQVSGIIDLYELTPHNRRQYVKLFLDALIDLPRELWRPTLIVIDEVHKFAPERGTGDAVSTQSVINLMSLGRKRGFSGILATQRFSKLHNDAAAETNNIVIGRTVLDADQKRAGEYLGLSTTDRRLLRNLKPGEFYAFGPAITPVGLFTFKADKVATSHPKAGERYKIKPPKASDVIKSIVGQIDDLPEVAEQEARDIASVKEQAKHREAELKATIHSLQTELAKKPTPVVETKQIPIFPEEKMLELQDRIDDYFKPFAQMLDNAQTTAEKIESLMLDMRKAIPVEEVQPVKAMAAAASVTPSRPVIAPKSTLVYKEPPTPVTSGLSKAEGLILRAFYWTKDDNNVSPAKIGFYSGYSFKSGGFSNTLSSLRTKGLLAGYKITDAGIALAAQSSEVKPTGLELREWLRTKLSKCENEILDVLVSHPRERLSNESIAAETVTQYSAASGGFSNAMSRLRSLEAAEGSGREGTKAADVFFE